MDCPKYMMSEIVQVYILTLCQRSCKLFTAPQKDMNLSATRIDMLKQIKKRFALGDVFSAVDLKELGTRAALDQSLSRLAERGCIVRIATGLYYMPRISSYSQRPLPPSPEQIIQALARKTGSRIMPSGASLANKLGLSDQVPASYEYLTDGRSKEFRIGALQIRLRRTAKNLMDLSGTIMGEVYMALRFLGKGQVNVEEVRSRLSQNLSSNDKKQLNRWAPQAPEWMRPIIFNLPS